MSGFPSAPAYPASHEFPAMPAMQMPMPQPYQPSSMPMPTQMQMPPMPMQMPMHMPPEPPPPVYCRAAPAITVQPPMVGPESMTMACPHCNCMISTETTKTHSACTHCCCLLMLCSGFFAICSCLPYFCCDPETVEHNCPNCHAKLGVWYP